MDKAALDSANKLLKMSGYNEHIFSLSEITPSMIYMIYETAFGTLPAGTIRVPTCQYDDELNIELILKILQDDVLQIDLGHIDSRKVVHGDVVAVQNIIEILSGYIEYVLEGESLNTSQMISDDGDSAANDSVNDSVDDSVDDSVNNGVDDGVDLGKTQRTPIKSQLSYVIEENERQKNVLSDINNKYEDMMRRLDESQDRGEKSPVKRELLKDLSGRILSPFSQGVKAAMEQESTDLSSDREMNTTAFTAGYTQGLQDRTPNTTNASSVTSRDMMLEKLNSLPHLSAALKSHGLDISEYSPSSTATPSSSIIQEPDDPSFNQIKQSTPYPKKQLSFEDGENEDPKENVLKEVEVPVPDPVTPKRPDLDESIKNRLLVLLERSGNTKHKKRQVRFDLPESPPNRHFLTKYGEEMLRQEGIDPHNFIINPRTEISRAHCENEIEKKILESELKDKVDLLINERKILKKLLNSEKKELKPNTKSQPNVGKKKPPCKKKNQSLKSPKSTPGKTDSVNLTDYLLPNLMDEFPFLHVSPQTAQQLWRKQVNQISALTKSDDKYKTKLMNKQVEEQEQRQHLLLNLMKKELDHTTRLHRERAKNDDKRLLKAKLLEQKLTAARVRKYHSDYCERTRARMVKKRTKEEQMFKELFEEGLKIQKERLQEMRNTVKEKVQNDAKLHKNEINSLENYYKNQYDLICSKMEEEQAELAALQEQKQSGYNSQRMKQRKMMRKEIEEIQEHLIRNDEDIHYHELDVQKALNKLRKT